ncbi:MAG: aldo/keto reductase [Actinobacteria bacterium]|nr:aldo/keto reductase [Actinomycetota bacterium]
MQYVKFLTLGINVSRFGMGCMRFPKAGDGKGKSITDEAESIKMVRYAVDNGVNYFDTAHVYGDSEKVLGKALSGGLRQKVIITTKSPVFKIKKPEEFEKILAEELERLQTDYIDFYLLHTLDKKSLEKVKKFGLLEKLDRAKKDGKIKYAGFSFHDDKNLFKEIIDSYKWDMCQIQLNFMGEDYQAGVEGLKYAASKEIGVVIMEPLLGGLLGENVPQDIVDMWNQSGIIRTPAEWGFRWIANFPEAIVILSGVSTMEQLKEDIKIFKDALPNSLTQKEIGIYKEIKKLYDSKLKVGCTGCAYCMPCPSGVDIPAVFRHYNNTFMGDPAVQRERYRSWLCAGEMDASQCSGCGQCEEECPQHIPIIDKLKEAHEHMMAE